MNWISFFICIFLTFSQITHITCSGLFELRLKSFRNDKGVNSLDRCCTDRQTQSGSCQGSCKTRFRVCLKQYQAEIDTTSSCTFGAAATQILGDNTFNLTQLSMSTGTKNQPQKRSSVINPIRFPFEFTWPGAFTLIVEAYHDSNDSSISRSTTESLIARFSIQGELGVGSNWTQYSSRQATKEIDFEYRVTCESNYYGAGCETLCRERDDSFGHFACSASGQRMCFSGWQGDYCTKPRCSIGCNLEHGNCEKPNECICKPGWKGPNCDECEVYPGCVHGTCTKKWECICREGWGGLFCNQDLNFCTNHKPCHNGGTCTNTGQGSYTCKCPPGFTGVDCEIKIKNCTAKSCLNNGTCIDDLDGNAYTCECRYGWIGKHCETQTVTCAEKLCLHGGICHDSAIGARCECTTGYSGLFCEMQVQNCSPNPCLNDGKCIALKGNHYQCQCAKGFHGKTCEENFDDCQGNPCKNGGTCIDGINQYQCKCNAGYTGENCEKRVDFCLTKPCANGGSCSKLKNSFQCICRKGFTGNDCSQDIDECLSSPCKNGATCINRVNSYECICPSDFHGVNCDAAISTTTYQERQIGQSENLSSIQIALIAFLSVAVPFVAICGIAVVICMKRKRKREQEKDDAEARKQNEQNASHISHLHQHHHNSIVAIKRTSNSTIALDGSGGTHHMIKNTWDKSVNNMTNSVSMDDGCMLNTSMNIYGTMCDSSASTMAAPSNTVLDGYQSQIVVPQTLQRAKSQKQLNTDAAVVNRASIMHRQQHSAKELALDKRISTYGVGEASWSNSNGNAASTSRQNMDRCSPPNI